MLDPTNSIIRSSNWRTRFSTRVVSVDIIVDIQYYVLAEHVILINAPTTYD